MGHLKAKANKWWQTMKVAWANILVYRVNFFLQVIGPTLVFFFIKYHLWKSIFGDHPEKLLQGYNLSQMVQYHLWVLVISLLGQGHTSTNLAEDIRMGRISTYLIYPFNFWEFHTANFLGTLVVQLGIVLFFLGAVALSPLVNLSLAPVMGGLLFTLAVGLFWFSLQYLLGLVSFWLEETWMLRVIFQIVAQFLSGAIIPLDLYPTWVREILNYTPFPYLTYVPARIFMGETHYLVPGLLLLGTWFLVVFALNAWVWKRGMKYYTAAGI